MISLKRKDVFFHTKKRIIISSTAIVFLCLFIFAAVTQVYYTSRVFNNVDRQLLEQKYLLHKRPTRFMDNGAPFSPHGNPAPPSFAPNSIVFIFDDEILWFKSPNAYFGNGEFPVFPEDSADIVMLKHNGYNFRGMSYEQDGMKIQLLINIDPELQSVKQLMNALIISLALLLIVAATLSAFLASRLMKPVSSAYHKQVLFVQDASHEMRTPLTVIKGKLELLAAGRKDLVDEHFEQLSQIMSEIQGLEKLSRDLLLLSKEDVNANINLSSFELHDFIADISSLYYDLAKLQEKSFLVRKPETGIFVIWDYDKMKQAVTILLENAFKYTPSEGKISLSLDNKDKYVQITVADNGIGIKPDEQLRIFDRFFRTADVRASNIDGSGIGLSLLKSLSNTLGFKIRVSSEYGNGAEFSLYIPKTMK